MDVVKSEKTSKKKEIREAKVESKTEDSDEEERTTIREDLSTMSFEEIMKLKEELGSKVYNEAIFGSNLKKAKTIKNDFKRLNKNRPREVSAKRPVPFLGAEERKKIIENKSSMRDPRFDENCGIYNSSVFKNNYSFINGIRETEVTKLKKQLKQTEDDEEWRKTKLMIQRLENQNREEKRRKVKEEAEKEEQKEIRKAIDEGHQPHFKTKKERKASLLVKQYLELKETGKLSKHLEKRRKKNTAKDRKKFSFD